MTKVVFPCGCKFNIVGDDTDREIPLAAFDKIPRIDISLNPWEEHSIYRLSVNCPAVWQMIGEGRTKGVFQLESSLGRQWSKKAKPQSLEDLGALTALIRPGCVSCDTKVTTLIYDRKGRNKAFVKKSIAELYKSQKSKRIVSLNERSNTLFNNEMKEVFYNGRKEVFRPLFRCSRADIKTSKFYSLECTADHPLLVFNKGWTKLEDIQKGDRVAVINPTHKKLKNKTNSAGEKNFRVVCSQNYEYKCVFCDWQLGSLDVNHLDGNRKSNNSKDNLCYVCPNHHRMYGEGSITKEQCVLARAKHVLPNTEHILWAEYLGCESLGIKDVYDIKVNGPNHNFIAGNVVVHNCLRAMSGDPPKSMTQRYVDRKHGLEAVTYLHQAIAETLSTTYGVLTYQEQAMKIAEIVAHFNKQEADVLRKAIGKKKADIMAQVEKEFLTKAETAGVITLDEAKEIFSWIRESQRYSFNKSHAITYGTDSYWSAYMKAHFPLSFFGSWIKGAKAGTDEYEEIAELLNDAKLHNIEVKTPQFHTITDETAIINDEYVQFGLLEIKDIGVSKAKKIREAIAFAESKLGKPPAEWTWVEFLIYASKLIPSDALVALISIGAFDYMDKSPRTRKKFEYERFAKVYTAKYELPWLQEKYPVYKWTSLVDALKAVAPPRITQNKVVIGGGGTTSKARQKVVESLVYLLENPPSKLLDTIDWIATTEEHYLGTPVTITKVDGREESVEANTSCRDFLAGKEGYMTFAVEVLNVQETTTKSGKNPGSKMARLNIRDSSCAIEAVCFPKQWAELSPIIFEGNTILMIGERTKDGGLSIKRAREIV